MTAKNKKTKINTKETSPYTDIRQTLKDREDFTKSSFQKILGREPSSREMSFYKYGEMEEDSIFKELLDSEEHKKLIEEAKESKSLNNKVNELNSNIEKLKSLIDGKAKEYRDLLALLDEKNTEIKRLRETEKNIYNQNMEMRVNDVEEILPGYSFEYSNHSNEISPKKVSLKREKDIFDKIRDILKIE